MTNDLRHLAEKLRLESARRVDDRREKCAQLLRAARALELLRQKLGGVHVR